MGYSSWHSLSGQLYRVPDDTLKVTNSFTFMVKHFRWFGAMVSFDKLDKNVPYITVLRVFVIQTCALS